MEIIDHDRRTQGGGYNRSPGGGSMIKKNPSGGGEFPLWGYFYVGSLFSPRTRGPCHFFRVCVGGGGSLFLHGGGGIIGLAPPPHNNFCGSLLSQKSFQIVEVLIFFEYFSFSHYYHYPITNPPPPPRSCMLPEKQSKWAKKSTTLS